MCILDFIYNKNDYPSLVCNSIIIAWIDFLTRVTEH